MRRAKVQINEMRLRVPGLTREQAQRLGKIVAERLAKYPMAGYQQTRVIPALTIRSYSNARSAVERTASDIAENIIRGIR